MPPLSATHRPAARSTTHPPRSQGPAGDGGTLGFVVHAPSTQEHVPGGGADSVHGDGARASTHRCGKQESSHPHSTSAVHATEDWWSRPRRGAAVLGGAPVGGGTGALGVRSAVGAGEVAAPCGSASPPRGPPHASTSAAEPIHVLFEVAFTRGG